MPIESDTTLPQPQEINYASNDNISSSYDLKNLISFINILTKYDSLNLITNIETTPYLINHAR